MRITDSLCCTPETNTTFVNQLYSNKNLKIEIKGCLFIFLGMEKLGDFRNFSSPFCVKNDISCGLWIWFTLPAEYWCLVVAGLFCAKGLSTLGRGRF